MLSDQALRLAAALKGVTSRAGEIVCSCAAAWAPRITILPTRPRRATRRPPYKIALISAHPPARDAFDLGAHQALDHAGQIVVEPGFEHRAEHFAHQIFQRAGVLHQHGLRQRIEGGIDRRTGCSGKQRGARSPRIAAALFAGLVEADVGSAVDGAELRCGPDRRSPAAAPAAGPTPPSIRSDRECRRTDPPADSVAPVAGANRRGRGGVRRRRRLRGECSGGDGGAGCGSAFGGSGARCADLVASSSAIMRRMEARISSIDGSCVFAGCVMPASPSALTLRQPPAFGSSASRLAPSAGRRSRAGAESATRNYATLPVSMSWRKSKARRDCGHGHGRLATGRSRQNRAKTGPSPATCRRGCARRSRRRAPADNAPADRRSAR